MEFCNGGELSQNLKKYQAKYNKAFPEEIVQYLMKQIVNGINYLHNLDIMHRDIKLDNILLHYDNEEDKKNLNIMKLIEIKQSKDNYYLVCELCNGGSLNDCLDKYRKKYRRPFTEEIVQYLMRQIVDAIKYLHSHNILHRDLKLDNILVNFENEQDRVNLNMLGAQVKIIDFGFATRLDQIKN
jgi:serine/threonine protein kinase